MKSRRAATVSGSSARDRIPALVLVSDSWALPATTTRGTLGDTLPRSRSTSRRAQAGQLAAAEPRGGDEQPQGEEPVAPDVADEGAELLGIHTCGLTRLTRGGCASSAEFRGMRSHLTASLRARWSILCTF